MTFPHTLQERKGPFTCPRCRRSIRFDARGTLFHTQFTGQPVCTWLDEATDEQVEALK